MRRRLARAVRPEPLGLLAGSVAAEGLTLRTPLRPRRGIPLAPLVEGDSVRLELPGRSVRLPAFVAPALTRLITGPARPADLLLGGLDEAGALVLARRMLREGAVVPA